MKEFLILILVIGFSYTCIAQRTSPQDAGWINYGNGGAAQYLQYASELMGPNALPVPDLNYANIGRLHKIEIGALYHHMEGDDAINSYFNLYWNIAPGRAAIEIYGYPTETFRMTNEVRDERHVYADDKGWMTQGGDIWVNVQVQLLKETKRLPDVLLNIMNKTTTGDVSDGRFTDAPLNCFLLATAKSFQLKNNVINELQIALNLGYYIWQTQRSEPDQDEGPSYGVGVKLRHKRFSLYNELCGYSAYNAYGWWSDVTNGKNSPMVSRSRIEYDREKFAWRLEFQNGYRDYSYKTLKLGVAYKFKAKVWY